MNPYLFTAVIIVLIVGFCVMLYYPLYRKLFDKLEKGLRIELTSDIDIKLKREMKKLFGDSYYKDGTYDYGEEDSLIKNIMENVIKKREGCLGVRLNKYDEQIKYINDEQFIDNVTDRINRKQLK